MTVDFAVEIVRQAVVLILVTAGPLLLVSLGVGVLVSLIQTVTQIQEQTLTFIPKILAIGAIFVIALPWMLGRLISFLTGSMAAMSTVVR